MLAGSAHFRDLRSESRETMVGLAKVARYRDGELVQPANPPSARLWLVLGGALRISLGLEDRSTTVFVIGPGSFYSAGALVGSRETCTDCHAVGETELAVIEGDALVAAAERDRALEKHLRTLLVRRFNALLVLFYDGMTGSLVRRLARRLVSQALAVGDR